MTIWNYVGSLSWHCETKLSIYRHKENLDVINTDDGTFFVEQCQTDRMFTRSLNLANVSMRIKSDTKKRLLKNKFHMWILNVLTEFFAKEITIRALADRLEIWKKKRKKNNKYTCSKLFSVCTFCNIISSLSVWVYVQWDSEKALQNLKQLFLVLSGWRLVAC